MIEHLLSYISNDALTDLYVVPVAVTYNEKLNGEGTVSAWSPLATARIDFDQPFSMRVS